MKPRFTPEQDVWIPYNNRALCVIVDEITWKSYEIIYEIQTLSEMGHQSFEYYSDSENSNCLLFETEKECLKWIASY